MTSDRQLVNPDDLVQARAMHSTVSPARGGSVDDEVSASFILKAFGRWWPVATSIGLLLATASAVAVCWLVPPKYRAYALIQIEDRTPYVVQPFQQHETSEQSKRFVQTQIELIRSPLVLGPSLSNADLLAVPEIATQPDPMQYLTKKIEVDSSGKSELYKIQFSAADPNHAALVVNEVVDNYFDLRSQSTSERAQRVISLLGDEKDRRRDEVNRLQAAVQKLGKDLKDESGLAPPATNTLIVRDHPLKGLNDRLSSTEVERRVAEARLIAYEESLERESLDEDSPEESVSEVELQEAVENTPAVRQSVELVRTKREDLQRILSIAANGKESDPYKRAEEELEKLEGDLRQARLDARPLALVKIRELAKKAKQKDLLSMNTKLDALKALEDSLRLEIKHKSEQLEKAGDKTFALEFARAELKREQDVYELISERALNMRTELRAPARVKRLQSASAPAFPVEKYPLKIMGAAALASFVVPFAFLLLWEQTIRRISDSRQIEGSIQASVIAEVAKLPAKAKENDALELYQESIDNLRTCLVLASENMDLQCLAVASAVSGEGKTSVAAQLASSIARTTDRPTLLIDADLRAPDIHSIFGVELEPGLTKALDGQATLDEAIVKWSDSLHLMPAGDLHLSPHKLFSSSSFADLIEQARQRYDHIVIDTPPVLSASESLLVAREADGTILVTMRDHSRVNQVQVAYQRLLNTGAHPLGAVLNGVTTRAYANSYGKYPRTRA